MYSQFQVTVSTAHLPLPTACSVGERGARQHYVASDTSNVEQKEKIMSLAERKPKRDFCC
jgi:hypothetical protein